MYSLFKLIYFIQTVEYKHPKIHTLFTLFAIIEEYKFSNRKYGSKICQYDKIIVTEFYSSSMKSQKLQDSFNMNHDHNVNS